MQSRFFSDLLASIDVYYLLFRIGCVLVIFSVPLYMFFLPIAENLGDTHDRMYYFDSLQGCLWWMGNTLMWTWVFFWPPFAFVLAMRRQEEELEESFRLRKEEIQKESEQEQLQRDRERAERRDQYSEQDARERHAMRACEDWLEKRSKDSNASP